MKKLIEQAIKDLKEYEPQNGYFLAFSGGKDSCVIKELAKMASVKHESVYSVTTIDPPELIKFIKIFHKDVIWDYPAKSFYQLLRVKGFPMRQSRWCCELLKERGGENRTVITGIRKEESSRRSKRKKIEDGKNKKFIHLIFDWTEADVWQFIENKNLQYCTLYDDGFSRIGCLFCPFTSKTKRIYEVRRYPKHARAMILNFEKLYQLRKSQGNKSVDRWKSGEDMFNWWIEGEGKDWETIKMFE